MKIVLISSVKLEKYAQGVDNDEDAELLGFLVAKGLDIIPAVWNDERIDWSSFQVAVIKSPWDYHHHVNEFLAWLDRLDRLGVKVLNPVEIMKWNSDKRYLIDIAQKGLSTIPSEHLEKGATFDVRFFDTFGVDRLVVKPCVSAGAENTLIVDKNDFRERIDEIDRLLKERNCLVQPFVREVKNGEWSLLFFNGQYSHSVLKTPKQGDFRVQHHYGGSISYPMPDPSLVEQAQAYLIELPQPVLYARVDGIVIDDTFKLMEIELIEPYLFLNNDNKLMGNYYQAFMDLIS